MSYRRTRTAVALLGFLTLGACAQDQGTTTSGEGPEGGVTASPGVGRLVIVGGALSSENAEVYQAITEARLGDGPVCVIPTASGDPAASMESSRSALSRYVGASGVTGILLSLDDPSRAQAPSVAAEIATCSGFYFTGGAQSRVVDFFLPQGDTTAAFRALWNRWREGAVLAGSSAGAAMMSGVMIASGGSMEAVEHGLAAEEDGDGVNIRPGMGFFTRAILDQHFLARGRIGRLVVATLATELPVGLGIDENTALVVDGDSARVTGASGVVVVDARGAERTGEGRGRGITVRLAGRGDVVDLRSFQVRRAAGKTALLPVEGGVTVQGDPFARWAFLHLVNELAASSADQASFTVAGADFLVAEAPDFSSAMEGLEGGVEGVPAGLSAGPFSVALVDGGG